MSDSLARFDMAVAHSKLLSRRPDNATLLNIYALYKQATAGDVTGERPDAFDVVACAKFDAWEALEGTSKEDAMARYAVLIDGLKAG